MVLGLLLLAVLVALPPHRRRRPGVARPRLPVPDPRPLRPLPLSDPPAPRPSHPGARPPLRGRLHGRRVPTARLRARHRAPPRPRPRARPRSVGRLVPVRLRRHAARGRRSRHGAVRRQRLQDPRPSAPPDRAPVRQPRRDAEEPLVRAGLPELLRRRGSRRPGAGVSTQLPRRLHRRGRGGPASLRGAVREHGRLLAPREPALQRVPHHAPRGAGRLPGGAPRLPHRGGRHGTRRPVGQPPRVRARRHRLVHRPRPDPRRAGRPRRPRDTRAASTRNRTGRSPSGTSPRSSAPSSGRCRP